MRNFMVLKNGEHLDIIHTSGNLKALCEVLHITGLPELPMHTYKGVLLAKVDNDQYLVFDFSDYEAHDIALSIIKKPCAKPVKKPRSLRLPKAFQLPKLPSIALEEPAYVV